MTGRTLIHNRHLKQQTSLHFVSADSADITYELHFQLRDKSHRIFLCVFVNLHVVAGLVILSAEFTQPTLNHQMVKSLKRPISQLIVKELGIGDQKRTE